MSDLYSKNAFRFVFYGCMVMAAFCLACAILSIGLSEWGQANLQEFSMQGSGSMDVRHDNQHSSDRAMSSSSSVAYDYRRSWGDGLSEIATSSFVVTSGSGGYGTQYVVQGSYESGKVYYSATKITGNASFSSTISLTGNAAGGENFDSTIEFDTIDGLAIIKGRVYNSTAGRPATSEELDAVGAYVLSHHLNISTTFKPENWLGSCADLDRDMILDPSTKGIYVAPLNSSEYDYLYDATSNSINRVLNHTL